MQRRLFVQLQCLALPSDADADPNCGLDEMDEMSYTAPVCSTRVAGVYCTVLYCAVCCIDSDPCVRVFLYLRSCIPVIEGEREGTGSGDDH